ncbi:MAG: 2-amino-4-hydroxy-6-hydroxymethyldihydropteridine diphosphokinase [Rhodospirillales bacterium]|nr:2-amino-4-hydroxy-6-hydroxymethyldihydropteridine diphosphokinase [Rhodospirillales bacterium]
MKRRPGPFGRSGSRARRRLPATADALHHSPPGARTRPRGLQVPLSDAVLIAIGANLRAPGFGPLTSRPALVSLRLARAGLRPERLSRLYCARPWPVGLGPAYVNAVALVRSRLAPPVILGRLLKIERAFGRRRRRRNDPRTLDLDLLAAGTTVTGEACAPVLPHPRLHDRAFVLRPLLDVCPRWRHPVHASPLSVLLARVSRPGDTWPWKRSSRRRKGALRLKTR